VFKRSHLLRGLRRLAEIAAKIQQLVIIAKQVKG